MIEVSSKRYVELLVAEEELQRLKHVDAEDYVYVDHEMYDETIPQLRERLCKEYGVE